MVVERKKKQKKGSISEDNIATVLQRYPATTVLALLQEVARAPDVKIDWNGLVKSTTTGITNPREYQMLWRHLAYRDPLLEKFEDDAKPLDDDSDLDYELEAFPPVNNEVSTEAAACVKVLIASGLPSDPGLEKGLTVEAPLTINVPNIPSGKPSLSCSMKGTNITIPVSVQKQQLSTMVCVEGLEANGGGNFPPRRKRKPWTDAEDMELMTAVEKCGEGNWANMLKTHFKSDRTASQLSQRWAIIRKKYGKLKVGTDSKISEATLAINRAVNLALNVPNASSFAAANPSSTALSRNPVHPTVVETSSVTIHAQNQSQPDSSPKVVPQGLGTSPKSRVISKKAPSKPPNFTPESMVKAAAVAAGARIATPSDAALLKAQAKNAIHIMPLGGGAPLIKSSVVGSVGGSPLSSHPNVHYIRTGLSSTPLSTYSTAQPNASRPHMGTQVPNAKSVGPTAQSNQINSAIAPELNASTDAMLHGTDVKTGEDKDVASSLVNSPKFAPSEDPSKDQVALLDTAPKQQDKELSASISGNPLNENVGHEIQESVLDDASNKIPREDGGKKIALPVEDGVDIPSVVMETCGDQKMNKDQDGTQLGRSL